MPSDAPAIWLLTDNKPGHRNQLKGLGNRLRVHAGATVHWIDAPAKKVPLWRALTGLAPAMGRRPARSGPDPCRRLLYPSASPRPAPQGPSKNRGADEARLSAGMD